MMLACIELPGHAQFLLEQFASGNTERVLERYVDVDRVAMQLEFALRDPRQIQQVVDQERFKLDVAV